MTQCCTVFLPYQCLFGNTEQTCTDDDYTNTTVAGTIYTPSVASSDCIALELACANVFDQICDDTLPIADPQSLVTDFDTPLDIVLTGSSIVGTLFFTITVQPSNGVLSGDGANWTYTPTPGFSGNDSFEFTVNDGQNESAPATISIVVGFAAISQDLETNYETPIDITLSVEGVDPDSVAYTVVSPPTHGILSGTGRNLTYTPDLGYDGPDSFTFEADDGTFTTDPATISITVLEQGVFVADFITLEYQFLDGLDLDTRTQLTAPQVGTIVGWCQDGYYESPSGAIWYQWSGDNTGAGFESVLFNVFSIRAEYPSATLLGTCRAWWYNLRVSGDVQLTLKAYQGGTMEYQDGQFRWINVGGSEVASLVLNANVVRNESACIEDPDCVTGFSYDLVTNLFAWTAC